VGLALLVLFAPLLVELASRSSLQSSVERSTLLTGNLVHVHVVDLLAVGQRDLGDAVVGSSVGLEVEATK
jgi:hypothetical protein